MNSNDLLYKIALTKIPSVGPILARELVSAAGSVKQIFQLNPRELIKVPGVGRATVEAIVNKSNLTRAEAELDFVDKNKIQVLFYLDDEYPARLKRSRDAPILMYGKGNMNLDCAAVLGVVGTRSPTDYGLGLLEKLLERLTHTRILIVSGLAYGVDIAAHRGALRYGLKTVGVLGSGLDQVYPSVHKNTAQRMVNQGGLLTEFGQGTRPDRENFPMRNRIIAGMCDALLVVESDARGGSMITADLANGYHKDVFAFPGRVGDQFSRGTNLLIKSHRAHLLESGDELLKMMKWDDESTEVNSPQLAFFTDLNSAEEALIKHLRVEDAVSIDLLYRESKMSPSELANHLLNLEFKGVVRTLPGKRYQLTR